MWPGGLQFNCTVPLGMTQETGEEDKAALKALGQNPVKTEKQLPHTGRAVAVHPSNGTSDLDSCSAKQRNRLLFQHSRFQGAKDLYSCL